MAQTERLQVARAYRRFAETEARGRSPLYEALALAVADDAAVIGFLLTLPPAKRQPNLLLAAVRHLCGTADGWSRFRRDILDNAEQLRALMLRRSTQTNEPGRCAVLLPVLAQLPQPLALIEVGASAGLCLLPDCYGYDYGGGHRLLSTTEANETPVFRCAVDTAAPLPEKLPQIIWRAGLDLEPLDVADPEAAAWLESLVWPEQSDRLARLRAAMRIAAAVRPRLVRGDLRRDLAALAAEAPREATRVVFHTAVLAYVEAAAERREFARTVSSLCDCWIANEFPGVIPEIAGRAPAPPPGRFLLARNGVPLGWTDPHGAALDWIDSAPRQQGYDESTRAGGDGPR